MNYIIEKIKDTTLTLKNIESAEIILIEYDEIKKVKVGEIISLEIE